MTRTEKILATILGVLGWATWGLSVLDVRYHLPAAMVGIGLLDMATGISVLGYLHVNSDNDE